MTDDTRRTKAWCITPLLLIMPVALVTGEIALAGVPAGVHV